MHPNPSSDVMVVLALLQYLGSVIVKRVHGVQSTEEACLRLRVRGDRLLRIHSKVKYDLGLAFVFASSCCLAVSPLHLSAHSSLRENKD